MTSPSGPRRSPSEKSESETEARPPKKGYKEKGDKTTVGIESRNRQSSTDDRDFVLTHEEAEAGSPPDGAACGEEDPGAGLELLVSRRKEP